MPGKCQSVLKRRHSGTGSSQSYFCIIRNLKVDNTTNSQVYLDDDEMKKKWGKQYAQNKQKIEEAIQETKGEVMTYQGEYISALFFSSSNGKTVNSEDYFTGEVAYLKSVDSHWDTSIDPHNTRSQTFTKQQLANIFNVVPETNQNHIPYIKWLC